MCLGRGVCLLGVSAGCAGRGGLGLVCALGARRCLGSGLTIVREQGEAHLGGRMCARFAWLLRRRRRGVGDPVPGSDRPSMQVGRTGDAAPCTLRELALFVHQRREARMTALETQGACAR